MFAASSRPPTSQPLSYGGASHRSSNLRTLNLRMQNEENEPLNTPADGQSTRFGSKTIGLVSSVMLLINNLAGPTVSLMPGLARDAGWLTMIIEMGVVGSITIVCGFMLISAMKAIPGNQDFDLRIEFTDLLKFYMPPIWHVLIMGVYMCYLTITLMTYIIQSAQVVDYLFLDATGCAYGVELVPNFGGNCGTTLHQTTPFGNNCIVLPLSFAVIATVCWPFSFMNLDDNVLLQWIAIIAFTIIAAIWLSLFSIQPAFPAHVPAVTGSPWHLLGVLLFNFAFMSTVPSWVNEKRPSVSVGLTFGLTMGYVVGLYTIIGIMGGLAFTQIGWQDTTLLSMLNNIPVGGTMGRLTVAAYPIFQNFTSIPVFSVILRYNVIQSGLVKRPFIANGIAVVLPWLLSIPFYTGQGFARISEIGGMAFSLVINFAVPVVLYVLSRTQAVKDGEVLHVLGKTQSLGEC